MDLVKKGILGFAWTIGQTVGTRLTTFIIQIIVARVITKEDFALFAIGITVLNIGQQIVSNAGLTQTLIANPNQFKSKLHSAQSFSLLIGIICSLIIFLVSFIVYEFYNSDKLFLVVTIFSLGPLIYSLSLVANSKLSIDLNFNLIGKTILFANFIEFLFVVLFLFLDFGVFSLVIGKLINLILQLFLLSYYSKIKIVLSLKNRDWKPFIFSSKYLFFAMLLGLLFNYGDNFIIGKLLSKADLADYFIAYSISVQSVMLLSNNTKNIFFSIFSKYENAEERYILFLRVSKMQFILMQFICVLIAVFSNLIVEILYGEKYVTAAPILAILVIAQAYKSFGSSGHSLLMSNMLYKSFFQINFIRILLYVFLIWAFYRGTLISFSIGVAISTIIGESVLWYFSNGFKGFRLQLKKIKILVVYFLLTVILGIWTMYFKNLIESSFIKIIASLFFVSFVFYTYFLLDKDVFRDMKKISNKFIK